MQRAPKMSYVTVFSINVPNDWSAIGFFDHMIVRMHNQHLPIHQLKHIYDGKQIRRE